MELSARGEYEEERFTFSDEGEFRNVSHDFEAGALAVKSLSPHWSAGLRANVASSTFLNLDLAARVAPAVEYDVFPYAEWTRRRLTLQYTVGVDRFGYEEITIFDRTAETRWDQAVIVSAGARQPWGTLNGSAELMHYLGDTQKNRIELSGDIEIRLFKGFELEIGGSYSRIRDQIYLPKGEATDEEVLVRRRQLATGYRYAVEFRRELLVRFHLQQHRQPADERQERGVLHRLEISPADRTTRPRSSSRIQSATIAASSRSCDT
jgi:hypothetical protein